MQKMKLLLITVVLTNCTIFCELTAQIIFPHPSEDPNWELVWTDEFDDDSIRTDLWDFHPNWGNCDGSSSITPNQNNHIVSNGMVRLVSKQEDSQCFLWGNSSSSVPEYYNQTYTSGCLFSKPSFKYGYFEIRSKFPTCGHGYTGSGFSPSFWMYPNYYFDTRYHYSEIDIYEIRGSDNTHTCNVHFSDSTHSSTGINYSEPYWKLRTDQSYDFIVNDNSFHSFAAEWDTKSIKIYYQNALIRQTQSDILDVNYLLPMNLFISNTANPLNFIESNQISSSTILPYYYDIDYVRVYQLRCDENTTINEILDFNNYEYGVKKSITLSGLTTLPNDTITFLRAKEFIKIQNDFEVPLGTSVYFIPCSCGEPQIINPN